MNEELRIETLLTFFFSHRENYKLAGVNRAYRDLNRTLHLIDESQEERNVMKSQISELIILKLSHLLNEKLTNQKEFDEYHKKVCLEIKEFWEKLTIGQIQKWINMTLKYWLIIGSQRINNIELNSNYFHIPIDSLVLKHFFDEKYPKVPWSKIEEYKDYFQYQLRFRDLYPNQTPIIVETEVFNKLV